MDADECARIDNGMTSQQQHALTLLTSGATISEVAVELDVHRSTVWRWTRNEEFAHCLAETLQERIGLVKVQLECASMEAVSVLHGLMTNEDQSGSVRVQAARELLDRAGDWAMSKIARERHRQVVSSELEGVLEEVQKHMTPTSWEQFLTAVAKVVPPVDEAA